VMARPADSLVHTHHYRALKRRRRLGGPGGPPPLAEVVARIEEVRDSGSPAQQRTLVTGP
jgi:hypothetical protein